MLHNKKIFRVFVSSTFSDMKAERLILQENVFKRLKQDCKERGAIFQDIDLRWGVTEEATKTHQTMKICLNEIARCQNISPKPNFIVLLGNRYGWQPLPAEIPAKETVPMRQAMSDNEKKLFDEWYKEDTNAEPPLYILQSVSDNAGKWDKEEDPLRQLLMESAEKAGLNPSQKEKYFCSATHQEIISGALSPSAGTYDPKEHVFCYFRKPVAIVDKDILKDYIDLDKNGNPDAYCQTQMDSLKSELVKRLPDNHIYKYSGVLEDKSIHPENPSEFADRIYNDLKKIIFKQLDEIKEEDALTQEIDRHNAFAERAVTDFTGREDDVDAILSYISGTDNRVYALVGDSGSGKTSVMARAANLAQQENRVIITRFLGTTGDSSNFESLLTLINEEIAKKYGADIDFMRGTGDKRKMEKDVFQDCLMLADKEKPLVVFLDALDQLPPFGRQILMETLPKSLPTYCRVVVSGTPEVEALFESTAKKLLEPMTAAEGKTLLASWLARADRKLRDDQEKAVIKNFSKNGLPLYLKLLFEIVRRWHSYDTGLPEIAEGIDGMLSEFFHALELQHTKELVGTVMGYLLCSRHKGLPENEALELLAEDKEYWASFLEKYPHHSEEAKKLKRIPVVLWSRLYLDLEPYLTERIEDGTTLLIFYHRQFGLYALNTYVREQKEYYYKNLGEYGEEGMRLSHEKGSHIGYTALYRLVYYFQAGEYERVKGRITGIFLEGEEAGNTGPVDRLNTYVIEEGSEEEKKRYKDVLEKCSLQMSENIAWGAYLKGTGWRYFQTVSQQWAIFYYREAIAIYEKIRSKDLDNINIAYGLAVTYNNLGALLEKSNRAEEAKNCFQKAIAIHEEIRAKDPDNIDIAHGLAATYVNLGALFRQSNRAEEAKKYFQKAIAVHEEIRAKNLDNIDIAHVLAMTYHHLGVLLGQSNRAEEAKKYFQKAIAVHEEIRAKNLDNIDIAHGLASTYNNLGALFRQSNRLEEAKKYFQKAIAVHEEIRAKNPDNIDISIGLASTYHHLGRLFLQSNQLEEGKNYFQKAIAIYEEIRAKNPDNIDIANGLASTYSNLGALLGQSNQLEEGKNYFQKAIAIYEEIRAKNPNNIDISIGLALTYGHMGTLFLQSNRPEDTKNYFQKAIAIYEKVCAKSTNNIDISIGLAAIYANLGFLFLQSNQLEEGKNYFQKAIAIYEEIRAKNPDNIDIANGLAATYRNLRILAMELYKNGEYHQARELLTALLNVDFEVLSTRMHLARIALITGKLHEAEQHVADAWAHHSEAKSYVKARILWMQLVLALLKNDDIAPTFGRLKTALKANDVHMLWSMEPVLDHLKLILSPDAHALLTALVAALSFKEKVADLDAFQIWCETKAIPLE